jgi:hypothetical protein
MSVFALFVKWGGVIGGLLGAFLLYPQRPVSKAWLLRIGIAAICLLLIVFKLSHPAYTSLITFESA